MGFKRGGRTVPRSRRQSPGRWLDKLGFTTPGGIKIEVLEDKALKVPIVFDHVHYFDTKLLDAGYYQVDEGGKKEGETPTYKR